MLIGPEERVTRTSDGLAEARRLLADLIAVDPLDARLLHAAAHLEHAVLYVREYRGRLKS